LNPNKDGYRAIRNQLMEHDVELSQDMFDMFMTVNGKIICSGVLADYCITEGTTVHISKRARGGCFMISFSIIIIMFLAVVGSCCTCGASLIVIPLLLPFLFVLPLFCL